jgi:hypothetical protein
VSQSSWLFGHYLLVIGVRLFVKNSKCVTKDRISLEKEQDWDFWSGTLLAMNGAVSLIVSLADKMQ